MKDTDTIVIPVIKNTEGKYLLITRTDYKDHEGEWGPIAGHVHEDGSVADALKRESKEELGVEIKPIKLLANFALDIPGVTGQWWECEVVEGPITANEEVEQFGYFEKDEIRQMKLWPATKKFFEQYVWQ